MSFRRTFRADVREQTAAQTESPAVARVRFYAANLSILFGLIGLVSIIPLMAGDISWAAAPGCVLMIAGGALGGMVHVAGGVQPARRFGLLAAICTVLGFAEFFATISLTS
ncbi:hypothetical protein GCM10010435_36390 [Winogradskya consettensis]|uniref:Uncharacterized protein n=1 Tax=Winogradskya consettensis TaxID=113560 RepID=A0A919SZT7_9ACTN|nr:hypothetical protein [Actinoplanes consettensis]GIM81694.1 hypothetical protein Aco04nite_77860 [Actinoplanes consettensis]